MVAGVPDRSFGNAGAIWSAIPTPFTPDEPPNAPPTFHFRESYPAYVGGTAIGTHRLGDRLALVAQGWAQETPGGGWLTSAVAVVPPPHGAPFEAPAADAAGWTYGHTLGPAGVASEALASCDGPGGTMVVLVRSATTPGVPRTFWRYALRSVGAGGPVDSSPVKHAWLFEPSLLPPSGNARILMAGASAVIVSTQWGRLRVTVAARGAPTQTATFTLAKKPVAGLVRMTVASLRLWQSELSVTLTAIIDERGLGEVSHGALVKVRLGAKITLDSRFGRGGVWVSPPLSGKRDFVCGGWVSRGVAGVAGTAAVAFAVNADGKGLDPSFGVNGTCEVDLGGALASPVATNDRNEWIYVFAQRLSDQRSVGCRIRVQTPLLPVPNGTVDPSFGTGGVAALRFDGAPAAPAAILLDNDGLAVAVTRQIRGSDCDRIPAVAALELADGRPDETFGAGGFALHGSVDAPARFAADGSCLFCARTSGTVRLVEVGADGGAVKTFEPPLGVAGAQLLGIRRLADASTLLSGAAAGPGWIAKLTPAGQLDGGFGAGGVARPFADPDEVLLVGVRADGRIVARGTHNTWPAVVLLHPDGTLDTTFGNGGYADLSRSTTLRVFVQDDDTLLCAYAWDRVQRNPCVSANNQTVVPEPARLALQRIRADGSIDAAFGWGAGNVIPSAAPSLALRGAGSGQDDTIDSARPAAIGILGGNHYLVATGNVGGRKVCKDGTEVKLPAWPTLLVTRFTADGTPDATFTTQVGGYTPLRLYWTAAGGLRESAPSLLVYGAAARRTTRPGIRDRPAVHQPQPALFRISDPGGIDYTFGQDGAATMTMQEFGPALAVAGAQLADGKVRLAVIDTLIRQYGKWPDPTVIRISSSFGGVAQFQ